MEGYKNNQVYSPFIHGHDFDASAKPSGPTRPASSFGGGRKNVQRRF
jgi:hypothetical protein